MSKFILDKGVVNRKEILQGIMDYLGKSFYDVETLEHVLHSRITARQGSILAQPHGGYHLVHRVLAEKIIQEISEWEHNGKIPTPKEKAKELIESLYIYMPFKDVKLTSCDEKPELIIQMERFTAKQCALVCVKVAKEITTDGVDYRTVNRLIWDRYTSYWVEVEKEIEKYEV